MVPQLFNDLLNQAIEQDDLEANWPTFRGANSIVQTYRGEAGYDGTCEFILGGPAETGKTWATLWLLDSLLRENQKEHAILARKQLSTIWGTVLLTFERILDLRAKLGYKRPRVYGGERPSFYQYENGTRLWIGGMDNPQKILSGERGIIYLNQAEEFELQDWETLLTRCTGRGSKMKPPILFGDANPGAEDHWLLKRKEVKMFHSKHVDNPSLYDERGELTEQGKRTMATLMSLTGIRRKRLFEGLWVGSDGLFFEEWDEALHTCEPFQIPADWPIWASFDYGYAHNTAFGLFTEKDGVIYLIAEYVKNKTLVPIHCRLIRKRIQSVGIAPERVTRIYAGHDCFSSKGDALAKTIADQYKEAIDPETKQKIGFTFQHANIARITGAQELLNRLGNREAEIEPRFKIFTTCKRSIAAMQRMVTDPDENEDVLKVDCDTNGEGGDDEYDMIRYGVASRLPVKKIPQRSGNYGKR
jgi:PBSX family phage terminase large subunit